MAKKATEAAPPKPTPPQPPPDPVMAALKSIDAKLTAMLHLQRAQLGLAGLTLEDIEKIMAADSGKMAELVAAIATSKTKHDALKAALDAQPGAPAPAP